ncbi:MAG: SpoIIE family protein phosphatase [Rubrobacteraceae bacterium]
MEISPSGVHRGSPLERRSSEELRRLLDRAVAASSNGIVITDPTLPDNPIVYVNPAFEKTTGYTVEEAIGRNCRFLQGEDRDQPAIEELRACIREGQECRVVLRNYRSDGTRFWNELYVSPVHDDAGNLTNFVGVQNDVTEIKRTEEVLKGSEDRLRLAVESTGLGTWDFNPVTGELKWDEQCKAVFGMPPGAVVDLVELLAGLHPDDRERTDQAVRQALDPEGDGEYNIEYRTIGLTDGIERWVAARGQAYFDEAGEARRFIGTVLDITERKRAEQERDLLLAREQLARVEAVRARRRLALLAAAGTTLSASLDYEATLEGIAGLVVPELADWCLVDVLEEDGSVTQVAADHADPGKKFLLRQLMSHRRFGEDAPGTEARVLRTGRPILHYEVSDELLANSATGEEHLEVLRRLEIRSLMSVPLLARGRTLGAVTLVSTDPERLYGEEDLSLAEGLAYRCALAVDNSRLYSERSHIARTLQRSLLPRLAEIPGIEVGVEYLPMGQENEVGGDFYDLIHTEGKRCLAVIGDVCGKGATAAAVTALTRYTIRAVAMREDEPSTVLRGLNEAMLRQLGDDQFCTVACARLEPAPGGFELDVARGGHPAPLLVRADGYIEAVVPAGRALGVFLDPGLAVQKVRLGPGDAAVFYTDGITEARGPDGSFFGERRLRDLLRACAGLDARGIAEKMRDVTLEFGEGNLRDDLALLVLRVLE